MLLCLSYAKQTIASWELKKLQEVWSFRLNAFEKLNTIPSQVYAFKIQDRRQAILIVVSSLMLGS